MLYIHLHLNNFKSVVIAYGRQGGRVCCESDGRQRFPFALEIPDPFAGNMLCIRRASPITEKKHLIAVFESGTDLPGYLGYFLLVCGKIIFFEFYARSEARGYTFYNPICQEYR